MAKAYQCQTKAQHDVVDKSNQSVSVSVHEEAREKEVRGAIIVVMNCSTSGTVNVVQQGSEDNGIDHTGLGKEWVAGQPCICFGLSRSANHSG